jgi:hypothetical protein
VGKVYTKQGAHESVHITPGTLGLSNAHGFGRRLGVPGNVKSSRAFLSGAGLAFSRLDSLSRSSRSPSLMNGVSPSAQQASQLVLPTIRCSDSGENGVVGLEGPHRSLAQTQQIVIHKAERMLPPHLPTPLPLIPPKPPPPSPGNSNLTTSHTIKSPNPRYPLIRSCETTCLL